MCMTDCLQTMCVLGYLLPNQTDVFVILSRPSYYRFFSIVKIMKQPLPYRNKNNLLCQVCSLSLVGLVLGTLPSGTIEQAEKTFKNTRTQGFYYRTIPSDECKYLFFLPIFFSYQSIFPKNCLSLGGVLTSNRLMGMCCWMGSRSHDWNGVANFRNFRGKKHSGKQGFKKWKIRGQKRD